MLFYTAVVATGLSVLSGVFAVPTAENHRRGPIAFTKYGPVEGSTEFVATNGPGGGQLVDKYLGIPFAQSPPVRFAPPKEPQSWREPRQATAFSPACVQQFSYPAASRNLTMALFNNPGGPPPAESEDCLYINVFTQHCEPFRGDRAVMVWIYGGGLIFGNAGDLAYDGSHFAAAQDVVLVTFNYRTNIFGFSGSPEIPNGEVNSGFLDQRFALKWVQENIAAFGGNPEKVTIFGESAGGYSVKQLVALPPKPAVFRGAILESEATNAGGGVASWQETVTGVGCGGAADVLKCMRAVPATTIQNYIELNAVPFGPTYDGITALKDVTSAFTGHTAANVPLFLGTNANEGRVFIYIDGLDEPLPPAAVEAFLAAELPGQTALQEAILNAYPASAQNDPYELISQIFTDLTFTCTTSKLSQVAAANGHDVWRYYYNASFPNTATFPDAGAYHSSEVPEVFGTYPTAGQNKQEVRLSEYMQRIWADFAKCPEEGAPWPKVGSHHGNYLGALGSDGSYGETTIQVSKVDFACPVYAPIIAVEGL